MMDPLSLAEKMNGLRPERLGSHGTQAEKTSDVSGDCESVDRAVKEHHRGDTSVASSAAGAPGAVTRVMGPKSKGNLILSRRNAIEVIVSDRNGYNDNQERSSHYHGTSSSQSPILHLNIDLLERKMNFKFTHWMLSI